MDDIELERIAARGWPGLRHDWLDGWLLRAGGGWTGRANSALPLRHDEGDLDVLLDRVCAWYRRAGLPPTIQVPLPARDGLRADLETRGWTERYGAIVMTADVADVLGRTVRPQGLAPVTVAEEPDEAWLAAYHYRGGALPAVARQVLLAGSRPRFLAVPDQGATVAICRVATDQGWMGITAVEVVGSHRRRGLATHLLIAALDLARTEGTRWVYLQTENTNVAAQRLYERAGFTRHHTYRYYRPSGDA
jgi:ribosomal protein S18 acetylase RimI-like enzyme